jgi:2-oxoglutarate/2-oxoacid ferredoxin oxidoreductase subunit alpha
MGTEKKLIRGNEAVCRGAVAAGIQYYFGYPITPQNDVLEFMLEYMKETGGVCVQAESELASINMVFGAAAAGGVTMTSTSSPGMALMQEGISYIAGARLPAMVLNVVRGGPGLGNIQPSQSDYFQSTRGGGHGDYYTPTFLPNSVQEEYDLAAEAVRVAHQYRLLTVVQTDAMLGQMMEPCELRKVKPQKPNYEWALTGKPASRERNIVRSLYLHPENQLTENNELIQTDIRHVIENEQRWESFQLDDAELILTGYGIVGRLLRRVTAVLRDRGIKAGFFRPITGFPFPAKGLAGIRDRKVFCIEMNYGQMLQDLQIHLDQSNTIRFYGKGGGWVPDPDDVETRAIAFAEE